LRRPPTPWASFWCSARSGANCLPSSKKWTLTCGPCATFWRATSTSSRTASAATTTRFSTLRASIEKLYLTHHALATVAQGNNPESLKDKLGELEAAGGNLGTFYTSQAK
jgi:hypothetical protein